MSKLKKLLIETPIDKLVELAQRKRGITVAEAAKILGVKEEQIEDWVHILEEHKMLKFEFPPIGEPKIIPLKMKPERFMRHIEEIRKKRAEIELLAKRYEEHVSEAENLFNQNLVPIEEDLYERLKELESNLKRLKVLKDMERKMENEIAEFERTKAYLLKEVGKLESKADKVTAKIESVNASAKELEKDLESALDDLNKHDKKMRILSEEQTRIKEELAALNKEIKIVAALAPERSGVPFIQKLKNLIRKKPKKKKRNKRGR